MKALITGAAGLVGSSIVRLLCTNGWEVYGVDNYMREHFFGQAASTRDVGEDLQREYHGQAYKHLTLDIRGAAPYLDVPEVDLIVHSASQPSHDWAAKEPLTDWGINATATLKLLEWYRRKCPDAVFIYMSTNKVYGDNINFRRYDELSTRFEPVDTRLFVFGVGETILPVDNCMHSLFGVSKLAGDLMTQEYGKYFGLRTMCFRCGCLTGGAAKGALQHGFLSYMAKCILNEVPYKVIGYHGKQVRDNLHASDVAEACLAAYQTSQEDPIFGEIFNLGGGRDNSISVVEAVARIQDYCGVPARVSYDPEARKGDHIWWITNYSKFRDWTGWEPQWKLSSILKELTDGE